MSAPFISVKASNIHFRVMAIVAPCSGIRGTYKREQSFYSLINAGQNKIYLNFTIKY